MTKLSMEQIVSLAKRRGFIYQHDELYGGMGSVWDYGPYGALMKENIKKAFIKRFVQERDDIVLVDTGILTKSEVFKASGHIDNFSDPLVECKKCNQRFRADQEIPKGKDHEHELTDQKQFNLMFSTKLGPTENQESPDALVGAGVAYLRPETAQGMFTNFTNILDSTRRKLPFGIAQIGKSFRNEITTGNFTFRAREFEIGEIEYFVKPPTVIPAKAGTQSGKVTEDEKWFLEWISQWEQFFYSIGIKEGSLHNYDHPKEGLAHYSKGTTDLEYDFPFGRSEIAGISNRTDFDLKAHQQASGKLLEYFNSETNEKYLPFVIEPTMGIDRVMLALLCDAIEVFPQGRKNQKSEVGSQKPEEVSQNQEPTAMNNDQEIVLHLDPKIAPIHVAILPLSKKPELSEPAHKIATELRRAFMVEYDETGSIGKRYRRQDEIGTPLCVTYDFESIHDKKVTVRNRDTMEQDRVAIDELAHYLHTQLDE